MRNERPSHHSTLDDYNEHSHYYEQGQRNAAETSRTASPLRDFKMD